MAMKKERQFLFNDIMSKCKTVIYMYVIKADVAFKSIKITFVTTYTCTHLILLIKKTMHGLVIPYN